jgi:flagellin-like hook-associated protein FlgL
MSSTISTNMASLYAQRSLATAQADLASSVEKLSSGKRINRAQDDVAGLGISEGVMGVKNITDQSIRSTQNAISVVQAAEGARQVAGKILQRVLTLTTQKENTVLNDSQLSSIDSEITSLLDEIGKIRDRTRFQGGPNSIFGTDISLIAGAGVAARTISIRDLSVDDLGVSGMGGTKTVASSQLAALFNRPVDASGIVIPTAQSMTSVPPISATGSSSAVLKSAQAVTLNGGQSATASNPTGINVLPAAVQPGAAPLPVASIGLNGNADLRFSVDIAGVGNTTSLYYRAAAGSSIQGLVDGTVYQISNAMGAAATNDFSFQLSNGSTPVQRLGQVVGTGFSFQKILYTAPFSGSTVDSSSNTILLGSEYGFAENTAVLFQAATGSAHSITGLQHNQTYYIKNVYNAGEVIGVQLKSSASDTQGIGINATQPNASFSLLRVSAVSTSFTAADLISDTLNLTGSTFQVGDQVQYQNNGQDIAGLSTGSYYVKTVVTDASGNNSVQLSESAPPTGQVKTFGAITGSGTSSVALIARIGGAEADSITSAGHGFQNGDAIKYTQTTLANEIGGLDTGRTYYVVGRDASGNSFKLSDTLGGSPIDLSSAGIGTQSFAKLTVFSQPSTPFANGAQLIYDGIASSGSTASNMTIGDTYTVHAPNGGSSFQLLNSSGNVVSTTSTVPQLFRGIGQSSFIDQYDAVTIASHGFQNGDVVKYSAANTASQIGGLITGSTYYVKDVSGNNFQLADASGNLLPLSSAGIGNQTFTKAAIFSQPSTAYTEGAQVIYNGNTSGADTIDGLDLVTTYKVHRRNDNNSFQLLDSSGNYVDITSIATGAQFFRNASQLPYVQNDTITIANHGLQSGDAIKYTATSALNEIGNLDADKTYYVRDVSGNSFKLASTFNGDVRDLTTYGSGTQTFTKGTTFSQPSTAFTEGTQVVYSGADVSGNNIVGLTVGNPYTIYRGNSTSSFQLLDSSGNIFSTSNAGTGAQIFSTPSSTLSLQAHGFSVGNQITYNGSSSGVGSDITTASGTLARGVYTVKSATTDTFQLANTSSPTVALIFTGAGSGIQQFSGGSAMTSGSIAAAIQTNAIYTAELGTQINMLSYAVDNMQTLSNNLANAYSRIVDVDYAAETSSLTRKQIMQEAATSMLAQANQMPNVILTLLT